MTSYNPVIKNSASGAIIYTALEPMTPTGNFLANPTLATGDVTISIDGGAFANLATLPDAEPNSGKSIRIQLSQAETNGDNLVIIFSDVTGAEWRDQLVTVQTAAANFDTMPTAAENADALLNRDMSLGTDSGSSTVRTPRQALRFLRNKWSIVAATLTVTKENDVDASWTGTVSTTPTSNPITSVDPAGP